MPILIAQYKKKKAGFILRPKMMIGRDNGNDIPLPVSRMSRVHACIDKIGSGWYIRDLGSSNGICVNGLKIQAATQLYSGDQLFFGGIRIKFYDQDQLPRNIKRLIERKDRTPRMRFDCKYCNQTLKARSRDIGRKICCKSCEKTIVIPSVKPRHPQKVRPQTTSPAIAQTPQKTADALALLQEQEQEKRLLKGQQILIQLMRDDRSLAAQWLDRARQWGRQFNLKLKQPQFPIRRWHLAAPAGVMVLMLSFNLMARTDQPPAIQRAASSYPAHCSNCQATFDMTLVRFEELSFLMAYPKEFEQRYPDRPLPQLSVCSHCDLRHVEFRFRVDNQTQQRSILAQTATPGPTPGPGSSLGNVPRNTQGMAVSKILSKK